MFLCNFVTVKKFIESLRNWTYNYPIVANVVYIFVTMLVLGFVALIFLDFWTHHGETTKVPDVKGLYLSEAVDELRHADLDYVVSDSVYRRDAPAGSVIDVVPSAGTIVKSGREVYLTIVAFGAEPVIIDMLLMDVSLRQAEAYFKAKGVHTEKVYVPAEYDDIVLSATCNGRPLTVGSKITVADTVVLEVGKVMPREPSATAADTLDALIEASLTADQPTADEPTIPETYDE